jgi:hypothetical protein
MRGVLTAARATRCARSRRWPPRRVNDGPA